MTKEKIQDFTLRISKANKTEMIAILYDMGIQYLSDALDALNAGEKEAFRVNVNRAKSVNKELMASVNVSKDLGLEFISLYVFCNKELTKAFLDYDSEIIERIIKVYTNLSEAYNTVSKNDTSGSVMGNSEKVYSGLTYNKSLLNNLVTDVSSSRGFLA
ncbi:MAG: flagellar protein FliS [Lachnospiraceae bacterium]|nr:flagellar protein FliS [Lachnospiraceae bacterium]